MSGDRSKIESHNIIDFQETTMRGANSKTQKEIWKSDQRSSLKTVQYTRDNGWET